MNTGNYELDRERSFDVTRSIARFSHTLSLDDLDKTVVKHAILVIRDTLGVMLAGSVLPEIKGLVTNAGVLSGPGISSLMGIEKTASPHFAALVNGAGAVSLELDEGNQYAVNHPAVHILPAALAIAEDQKRSGKDLLAAFIAGYEVAVRIGRATHLRETVHPFGTHAIVGTAVAVSMLTGLNIEETAEAIDLSAGICIASSQTAANSGASVRNIITGLTNHNGILAPLLVRSGFTGEKGALDIVFGTILGDSFVNKGIENDLGIEYYIKKNYFKLHACSRWNHSPIEAMANLLKREQFSVDDIAQIKVWTYNPATRLSWGNPVNGYAAKHSIPYNVAARLIYHSNDIDAYSDDMVCDPRIQAVTERIKVLEDPALTAMLPDVRPARIEVALNNGTVLVERVDRPQGCFDRPFSEIELEKKFRRLASMVLSEQSVSYLEDKLSTLPDLKNISLLSTVLQGIQNF